MNDQSTVLLKRQLSDAVKAMRVRHYDKAISITQEIITAQPRHQGAHAVQFSCLFKAKRFEQARQMGAAAAALNPTSIFILNNQACLQLEAKQPLPAAGLLRSLVDQFGERSQWLYNLALAQRMVGNYDYSIATFRRTLEHQPDHNRAAFQLAECLSEVGHKEEALHAFDYVRLLRNKHAPSHGNYIHHAAANQSISQQSLRQEIRLWQERFVPSGHLYSKSPIKNQRKIRLGFLLGVLPSHWLESTVAPLINQLAGNGFSSAQGAKPFEDSIFVYWHDEKLRDDVFDQRVEIVHSPGFNDADFARRVRNDRIDTMIDICGMRRGSRQRTLGLQLAAKEFGWLAHEGLYATALVSLLDKRLGKQRFYVASEPPAHSKPMPEKTLCGIGCRYGLSHKVIKVWAKILRELPDWNLHLDSTSTLVNKSLVKRFLALGIKHQRLSFDSAYTSNHGTIVLDNFIENDPIAAANAIANGGVLITLEGDLFPAQQNRALLEQVGCPRWIVANQAGYINRAIALAEGMAIEPVDPAAFEASGIRNLPSFAERFRTALLS